MTEGNQNYHARSSSVTNTRANEQDPWSEIAQFNQLLEKKDKIEEVK